MSLPSPVPRTAARAFLLLVVLLACAAAQPGQATAAPCTPPVLNEVACENTLPGLDPSVWQIDKFGDGSIQGYATSMSVNRGSTVSFKIKSQTTNFRIDILRLGYYGGKGARLVASSLAPTGPSSQPACQTFADTGLIDCGNWAVTRSWPVPSTAVSGVYIALLRRLDTGGSSHIPFIVRDDASDSDLVFQTSDTTWQAYNTYGGNSTYTCNVACPPGNPKGYKGAFKVSYNRPFTTAQDSVPSWLFSGGEYPMIRFLEANGYDVSYISGLDTDRRGGLLTNHKAFLSVGHDEYWSGGQRTRLEAARAAGVDLALFSGNLAFWKIRWEPSADGANTPDRTMVTYKDTHFDGRADPVEWTGTWRDTRFTTAAELIPENALVGTSFEVNSGTTRITVPAEYGRLRLWRNTAAATLAAGTTLQLAPQTLGYEWDVDADNGYRPAGQFRLSSTTASGLEVFTDYGSSVKQNGTATHNLVMYKQGASRVFSAGTVQWSWGLDDQNEGGVAPDRNMQQATVNLFADMGVQPGTLRPGLVAATASTDATPPSSAINTLPASVAHGAKLTITGTATDSGGRVAGVEVSTDGGATWHPATSGTTSWSYSWIADGAPSRTIRSRAVDDSGNLEAPGAGRSIAVTCPCSLFGPNLTPSQVDSGDPSPLELGVKFRSEQFGTVSAVRFYKSALNTGPHTGSLWSESGERLATGTFTNETTSGWQTLTFSSPVEILPDTTYVASYHTTKGHYSATGEYFYRAPSPGPNGGARVEAPPLRALRNEGTTTNGVYAYGTESRFPTSTFAAANYWVDVVFNPMPPPGRVTGVVAQPGGRTSANLEWNAPADGGRVTAYRITPYVLGLLAQTPTTITGSPPPTTAVVRGLTQGTTYGFTVQALNPTGAGQASPMSNLVTPQSEVPPSKPTGVVARPAGQSARVSWEVPANDGDSPITGYVITPYDGAAAQPATTVGATSTTATVTGLTNGTAYTFRVAARNSVGTGEQSAPSAAVTPQATLFEFAEPLMVDSEDPSPIEVGVKFTADHDGTITGIRFFKSAANTGTHTGSLWTATGVRLAQATFTGETASGWQHATFATPVPVTAGTTYVASYFAPRGRYAATSFGLQDGVDRPPLRAVPDATSSNGVFTYAATSSFPSSTYRATNYWVDVLYAVPRPGQATGVTAAPTGPSSAEVEWTAPATGGPVTSYKITPYVAGLPQTATVITGNPPPTRVEITGLTSGTTYTFGVQAANANGPGPESAKSNSVTPIQAVAPTAPQNVAGRPATNSALVTWSPPLSDGGSPISSYTVTPFIGSAAQPSVSVAAPAVSTTVTGLANDTSYTFRVTATNREGTSPQSAASAPVIPRITMFDFATPSIVDSGDTAGVEVGVKFRTDFPGTITGIRFHKSAPNTGTHVGNLWSATGTKLAGASFSGESASGWQTVLFGTPVSVAADTTYVASYYAPKGRYSVTANAFGGGDVVNNPPLRALANSTTPNGVYAYGNSSRFPTLSFNAANYWVDVLYRPAGAPGTPTGVTATAGRRSATVSWTAPTTGGPVTRYTITPYVGETAQTPTTIIGSPPATSTTVTGLAEGTAYTFSVRAGNFAGDSPESTRSSPVTPVGATAPGAPSGVTARADSTSAIVSWTAPADDGGSSITGYTVTPYVGATAQTPVTVDGATTATRVTGLTNGTAYTFRVAATNAAGTGPQSAASSAVTPQASIFELATPAVQDAGDTAGVTLGVKFTADVAGSVTGVRFYKAPANSGTHVGGLWTAGGTLLAQTTFAGESASGWQTMAFPTPVAITPGAIYVASYHAPNGHYSVTGAAFSAGPFDNPPLHAVANSASPNGVFGYGAAPAFPTGSFNATNYWVDVLFAPGP